MYLGWDMNLRAYEMRMRAESTAATRASIVRAATETFMAERTFNVTLGAVAERADVTTKTILRHFGSRDALLDEAWGQAYAEVLAERTPPTRDVKAALDVLIAHYEVRGDVALGVLAEEDKDPRAKRMNDAGRAGHRSWVDQVFDNQLPSAGPERARLVDALVVVTDVYAWKLLRRDRRLTSAEVHDRMTLMSQGILLGAQRQPLPEELT